MNPFSIVFPGQGSQKIGMGLDFCDTYPIMKQTLNEASAALGYDLFDLLQNGPEEKLNQTEFTQPALLAVEVGVWRCWLDISGGKLPEYLAGHSLGEYTALVCADAIDFSDAVRVVRDRGRFMQEAVLPGEGAMAAIIGLDEKTVVSLCQSAGEVSPANYNSLGQIVVAGKTAAVQTVVDAAKAAGAKLAKMIPVSVPSHCALMQSACDKLDRVLQGVSLRSPKTPVIHNATVQTESNPVAIRKVLVQQLVSPVRWVETMQLLLQKGCSRTLECGPGKVLAGLITRIDPAFSVVSMNSVANLEAGLALIK